MSEFASWCVRIGVTSKNSDFNVIAGKGAFHPDQVDPDALAGNTGNAGRMIIGRTLQIFSVFFPSTAIGILAIWQAKTADLRAFLSKKAKGDGARRKKW